jgi:hypothetical protein
MSEIIPVKHVVYDKNRFSKVINTQFTEFTAPQENPAPEITAEEFFKLYEELFFIIPKEGEINSHNYILNKEAQYLGVKLANEVNIDSLLQEVTSLRQQVLSVETENLKLLDQLTNTNG